MALQDLKLIFSDNDISAFSNDFVGDGKYSNAVVSFSAWNSKGNGTPFGPGFFKSRGIPAIFVVQHRNHWWHTEAVFSLAHKVKALAAENGLGLVCYGSSMGGYGSIHLSRIFGARKAVAIAPQIFISESEIPEEKRWEIERKKVELIFGERENLSLARCDTYIFYDNRHAQDKLHVDRLVSGVRNPRFQLVEVPFASHDVARALVAVSEFKHFVEGLACGTNYDLAPLEGACRNAYQFDDKAFLNRVRSVPVREIQRDEIDRLLKVVSKEYVAKLDFEALYFAAEGLMNLGFYSDALACSSMSLEKYPLSSVPRYLELKHERVFKAFTQYGSAKSA